MNLLKKLTDNTDPNSLASKMRLKRFSIFLNLVNSFKDKSTISIIDVGGDQYFWKNMGFVEDKYQFTVVNLEASTPIFENFKCIAGDARNLSAIKDKEFDIAFSNSVIEHVGTFEDQKEMAKEMQRVGKVFYLQTPSYYFPIEPHFLVPFFHWLPVSFRIWIVVKFSPGWYGKCNGDEKLASEVVNSIRLMTYSELKELFPTCKIKKEKFLGITKSYIVTN